MQLTIRAVTVAAVLALSGAGFAFAQQAPAKAAASAPKAAPAAKAPAKAPAKAAAAAPAARGPLAGQTVRIA